MPNARPSKRSPKVDKKLLLDKKTMLRGILAHEGKAQAKKEKSQRRALLIERGEVKRKKKGASGTKKKPKKITVQPKLLGPSITITRSSKHTAWACLRASVLLILVGIAEIVIGLRYRRTNTFTYEKMQPGAWWCGAQALVVGLQGLLVFYSAGERSQGGRFFFLNCVSIWTGSGIGCFSECSRFPEREDIHWLAKTSCSLCGTIGLLHLYALHSALGFSGAYNETLSHERIALARVRRLSERLSEAKKVVPVT
jgi:hypothetical protein